MKSTKQEIISILSRIPLSITESDIQDMFYIAEQHFLKQTPSSINNYQRVLFQVYPQSNNSLTDDNELICQDLSNFLCLPISVDELINSCKEKSNLHYFVVDCRPPDQYNNGHLCTAFHLDCSLMLHDPSAFTTAVQALLAAQKQAIEAGSIAAGEHLCFMGSGNDSDQEQCYVNMVVSSFLQKHHKFVSLLFGGYKSLHNMIMENQLDHLLFDHNQTDCLECISDKKNHHHHYQKKQSIHNTHSQSQRMSAEMKSGKDVDQIKSIFFQKFSNVVKPKITEMKEKLVEYVVNPSSLKPPVKHVSADNLGKRYKGSKFSLEDSMFDLDEHSDEYYYDNQMDINFEEWKKRPDVIGCFECSKIISNGMDTSGYLGLTHKNLYLFKHSRNKTGYGKLIVKRPLETIFQITSKRKCPEIITFKYGSPQFGQKNELSLDAKDSLILLEPFEVIRLIKQQVVILLDQNDQALQNESC
ncbi:hypothetical protein SSS_05213 [Sarcoptes scabiei]|nr:hypothetical protein SSS_05213 [Sarcoptes scabiei]